MANLLQSIPVYKPQVIQQPAQQTPVSAPVLNAPVSNGPVYDYVPARPLSEAVTTPQGIGPQKTAGYLVRENVFQSAGSTVKSYGKYAKYFTDAAFKGEGTDYSVGKINDLAIRAGSLGIAGVLACSKMFPFAKGMEFVGLATWFASMAIWPKVIGAPIKAAYGVDINQKYVDSYGRRKSFFEDPQYLPWDLYRHIDKHGKYNEKAPDYEYLEKIGDKLGVPRDIENRHEEIHNKMKQVAIQGNTLWMLTAGVMTPIISSIAADGLQGPVKNLLENQRIKNQENELAKLEKAVESALTTNQSDLGELTKVLGVKTDSKVLSEFKALNKENLSDAEFTALKDFMKRNYFGTGLYESMEKEMTNVLNLEERFVRTSPNVTDDFQRGIKAITEKAVQDVKDVLGKNPSIEIPQSFADFRGLSEDRIRQAVVDSFYSQSGELNTISAESLRNKVGRYLAEDLKQLGIKDSWVDKTVSLTNEAAESYFEKNKYHKSSVSKMEQIFKFAEINSWLKKKVRIFEKATIRNVSESTTANNWGKVPQKYLKALGFNKTELAQIAATDSSFASQIIARKFEEIAKDPAKLDKVVSEMSKFAKEAITKEEKAVIKLIGTTEKPGVLSKIKTLMEKTSGANFTGNLTDELSKYYYNKVNHVENKLRNTVDSFARPIKAIDTFKDVDKVVLDILGGDINAYNSRIQQDINSGKGYYYTFHNTPYEEAKGALKAYIKDVALEKNDINNWTTKFEATIGETKRGMNHSLGMVTNIANTVNGEFSEQTAKSLGDDMARRMNLNNLVMKFRFLGADNKIWPHANEAHPSWSLLSDYFNNKNLGNYESVLGLIEARKAEMKPGEAEVCKKWVNDFRNAVMHNSEFKTESVMSKMSDILSFKTSSKNLAEMSGKNVTDFIVSAAENARSRNKWSKLAYGILIGTTVFTAGAIALMGKKNYFNKGPKLKETEKENSVNK